MMTADRSLFLWNKNDDWWDYDENGKVILTDKAPDEAKQSFGRYCNKLRERGEIIDKYHLNVFCICSKCKKKKEGNYAYSCKQYNKEKGIPAEIWNKENAECPYFEPVEQELDKN